MADRRITSRDVFLEPLAGTAYVIVLTGALIAVGYGIAALAAWLG